MEHNLQTEQKAPEAPDFSTFKLTTGVMTLALRPTLCTYIIDEEQEKMVAVMTDALPPAGEIALANLFAAAPELLEAVKKAATTFHEYGCLHAAKTTAEGKAKAEANFALEWEMQSVIAKATGGQQ